MPHNIVEGMVSPKVNPPSVPASSACACTPAHQPRRDPLHIILLGRPSHHAPPPESLLGPQAVAICRRLDLEAFVSGKRDMKWCPGAGCVEAVERHTRQELPPGVE